MARYTNIPIKKSLTGNLIYKTVRYPEVPRSFNDLYIRTTIGDRYDTLALQYYQDSSLWWIISIANNSISQDSLTPPLGTQIRIPINPSPIISAYNSLNPEDTLEMESEVLSSPSTTTSY